MGATLHSERTILVVVHHLTGATRLLDVVPLVERDRRVQTIYTVAPASVLSAGVSDYLRQLGAVVLPFDQATHVTFDLAIAAGQGSLEQLHAPVMMLPHGIGPAALSNRWAGSGLPARRGYAGLRPDAIVAGGRVIPSVIGFSHADQLQQLADRCPEAVPAAQVVGDPVYDRLILSRSMRCAYRKALGAVSGRRLVVVSSTWGRRSLLGRHPELITQLAAELPPDRYKLAVILHPNTWCWNGRRTVTAWLDDCLRRGAALLPPEEGWRAALIAADVLIGDHGSVTYYGAAAGIPVVLAAFPSNEVLSGSHLELLGKIAPRLALDKPLRTQLDDATNCYTTAHHAALGERLTSQPGRSAAILRNTMYRLMRLTEPTAEPCIDPIPLPQPLTGITPAEGVAQ